jgi:hypothetical protein
VAITLGGVYFLWQATHEETEAAPTTAPSAVIVHLPAPQT